MGVGVLAHQGGWDEALLVALPLLLFGGLVWNAKRHAAQQAAAVKPDDRSAAE